MTTRHEKKLWQIEMVLMVVAAVVALGVWLFQRYF